MELSLKESEELREVTELYQSQLNKVNLLLYKEHELRRDEDVYHKQIQAMDYMIRAMHHQNGRSEPVETQDEYLRTVIQQNQLEIVRLQQKMETSKSLASSVVTLDVQHRKYIKMAGPQFQSNIQQKLSTMRGLVDELKKKIKQINKQLINSEQEHFQAIDQFSFNVKLLNEYKVKNEQLKSQVAVLLGQIQEI